MSNYKRAVIDHLYQQLIAATTAERLVVLATIQENEMDQATTTLIGRLDTATTAIATKLQALVDKANTAGSVTAAEIDAALTPSITALEAMGTNPADPVPQP